MGDQNEKIKKNPNTAWQKYILLYCSYGNNKSNSDYKAKKSAE